MQVKVIITEGYPDFRQGLSVLLQENKDLTVVGKASTETELLDLLSTTPVDVVLLNLNLPGMNAYEATERIARDYPRTKVIALSMQSNLSLVQKIINCGASGYLLTTTGKEEIQTAVKLVAKGILYICNELSILMLTNLLAANGANSTSKAPFSKQELEVLRLISEGFSNAEIADKLLTSKCTIETNLQNILEKSGTRNSAHLIRFAIEHQLIKLEASEYCN